MLQLIDGPPTGQVATRWRVEGDTPLVIGRGQDARVQLPDASISRKHAEICFDGVEWVLRDLGSRHGTGINGRVIPGGSHAPVHHRDEVQVGPWVFRVLVAGGATGGMTLSMTDAPGERVRRLTDDDLSTLARRRLDLVLAAAEAVGGARDEQEVGRTLVDVVLDGAGSARVALVKVDTNGHAAGVLGAGGGFDENELRLSSSLVQEAARGATVVLESGSETRDYGQSIMSLGIHSAFCAPVRVGERVEAVLYLDARGTEGQAGEDAAAFVGAMARIGGLALGNLRRASLERHRVQLESDLAAARVAQRIMMPAPAGRVGEVSYAMVSRPGRFVAGDLLGLEVAGDGRVVLSIGDVTGKGAGAAMLMGIAQSYLAAAGAGGLGVREAVRGLNAMLAPRIELGRFISLWLGEYDPATRRLRSVDAGHGYTLLREPGGSVVAMDGGAGIPVGIDPDWKYEHAEREVAPGSLLLLFSDGLVEQTDGGGEQFGLDQVRAIFGAGGSPETVTATLERALLAHAGSDRFNDDLTIACVRVG